MIRATLHALENKQFLCTPCIAGEKYSSRQDKEKMIQAEQTAKSCNALSPQTLHQIRDISGILNFRTCIGNFVSPAALNMISQYGYFEKGFLPYPGTFLEQPNKIMEAFNMIEAHRLIKSRSDAAKQEAQSKARMSRGR